MSDELPRSDLNEALLETTFLYGGNAEYVEQMHARYASDPNSVDASWRAFFEQLGDAASRARQAADGPSWDRPDWPPRPSNEHLHAIDGDWPADKAAPELARKIAERPTQTPANVRQETQDSIRALMMIRAYRIRGHLAADLDPLRLTSFGDQPELEAAAYGFGPDDLDRPIFIDGVLGLETGDCAPDARHSEAHLLLHAGRGVHAHLRSGGEGVAPTAH